MNEAVDFSEGDALTVDFNDVEETSFEALPKAMYNCVIAECEFGYSQNSGNAMWTLQLEVADGEYAGRKLFNHMTFTGGGVGFTKRDLKRIAPELLEAPFQPNDPEVVSSMLGKQVRCRVTTRKDPEGETRNNISGMYPVDGDGFV